MTTVYDYIDETHIQQLHDFLTAREWNLSDHVDRDEHNRPVDPEPEWYFPATFQGIAFNDHNDIGPAHLHCKLDGIDGPRIVIRTAGNFHGCDLHDVREHDLPPVNDELSLDHAATVLTSLEVDARALNAADLVHCRFFGPCGETGHIF